MTIHFDNGNPFITILVFLKCNTCICNCGDFRGRNGSCLNIYVHKSQEIYACTHLFCSGVVIFPNFNGHVIDLPVFFRVASLAMWQSCHFRRATYIKSSGNRYVITSTEQALFCSEGIFGYWSSVPFEIDVKKKRLYRYDSFHSFSSVLC